MARSTVSKKLQLARAWVSRNPVWCSWQVNYRCNFHCNFCNYWIDPMGDEPEMSPADFRAGAKKLADLGTLMISMAGGEPFIRHDMVEIVAALAKWHFPFVTTNGWFITPELARDLWDAGLWGASVSIDYAEAAKHDKRRGMPGCFDRAVAALERLSGSRTHRHQRVNWMSVLMDDNLDQIEPMIRMAADRGAYFMVQPYGVRKTGSQRWLHENDGTVSQHLLKLRARYPNFLSNPYFLSRFDEALNGGVPGCKAGRGFFNIDSTGDIAVCVEERAHPVANLYRDSARDIVRALRGDDTPNHCTACWYNCRGEVESLYKPVGVLKSLPTFLMDRGRAPARV